MNNPIGCEAEICSFCGGPEAGYARRKDGASGNSEYFSACESCARKPYPQPKQLVKENQGENNEHAVA